MALYAVPLSLSGLSLNMDEKTFVSWSGGKDSCLALFKTMQNGNKPDQLLTMFTEGGERTKSHGLHRTIVEAQAEALSLPLFTCNTSWDAYENIFLDALRSFKNDGVSMGVFGDIDLEPHREWVERVCGLEGIHASLPLWKRARKELLTEFLDAGFSAIIIAVKDELLDTSFLGRTLNEETITDLENSGVDACGEEGEYHTVVIDGPIFSQSINVAPGEIVSQQGYSFLDIKLTLEGQA